ncbi:flagellar assembly protein FliW [Geothrix sp. 21YS21S-4]|uniref:flagellar assembly protein FliW n=1 Tax=Geothrix sp. 21YS21S-4 TaxID=3068889 RepID=UPI0027B94785|nr:flagellar assembly protein FliW [Geothrix sp. 21YS21S-4]
MTTSDDGILLSFPKGLLGFPQLTSFRLFEPRDGYPLKFLQAVEAPEVSFTCLDPAGLKEDYTVPLGDEEAEALGLEAEADALILTLVVIPEDPRKMTTNLAGPLVINVKTRMGYQIALNAENYPLRFPILSQD